MSVHTRQEKNITLLKIKQRYLKSPQGKSKTPRGIFYLHYRLSINLRNAALPSSVHLYTPACSRTFINTIPISFFRISSTFSSVNVYFSFNSSIQSACFASSSSARRSSLATTALHSTSSSPYRRAGSTARPITSIRPMFSFLI